ncbi:hypothetical protein CI105_02440 [Candidatus Izimaplasma bacterium ZiA1]|uniref:methionine ABC transporter ATP-binding protein n=1 Tax=Candidatus Izimoplasma sp. ZiA1 TaxID=2024899 RepID=UPI000BAA7269|nr:hypothetical protein CI105_02440 [Candidatus Izimaplasma bacterium ZiA1]
MISINNVSKIYKTNNKEFKALQEVSLNIKKNTIHGIIGESGAGKSTLIRLINGLEDYQDGTVDVFEYKNIIKLNMESSRMLKKRIGMIYQSFNLLERKTVLENVLMPISINGKVKPKDLQKAKNLINLVGLSEYINKYPNYLSGGQKQRVGIARSLINDPEILLCDEPTSALDPTTIKSVLDLLKDIKSKFNITVVIVTHDMYVIKEICDYVTVMENGKIIENGYVEDVFYHPVKTTTKSLLSSIGLNYELIVNNNKHIKNKYILFFDKSILNSSIITEVSMKFKTSINILYASITPNEKGVMVVQIPKNIEDIRHSLMKSGVVVENV